MGPDVASKALAFLFADGVDEAAHITVLLDSRERHTCAGQFALREAPAVIYGARPVEAPVFPSVHAQPQGAIGEDHVVIGDQSPVTHAAQPLTIAEAGARRRSLAVFDNLRDFYREQNETLCE